MALAGEEAGLDIALYLPNSAHWMRPVAKGSRNSMDVVIGPGTCPRGMGVRQASGMSALAASETQLDRGASPPYLQAALHP